MLGPAPSPVTTLATSVHASRDEHRGWGAWPVQARKAVVVGLNTAVLGAERFPWAPTGLCWLVVQNVRLHFATIPLARLVCPFRASDSQDVDSQKEHGQQI